MLDELLRLRRQADTFAAVEHAMRGAADPLAGVKALDEAMRHLYWKEKDLAGSVALGRAGVQLGLSSDSPDVRAAAKGVAYNLASFTWPGWDEPGIPITPADVAIGLDAAKVNLRLAVELKKDELPLSRAHWILAGQWLATGDREPAVSHFTQAAAHAARANSVADQLHSQGFAILARGRDLHQLDAIRAQLKPLEHGEMLIGQIDTALRAFPPPAHPAQP